MATTGTAAAGILAASGSLLLAGCPMMNFDANIKDENGNVLVISGKPSPTPTPTPSPTPTPTPTPTTGGPNLANYTVVAVGIDSLSWSLFPYYWGGYMRGEYGDGGLGYQAFTADSSEFSGSRFNVSGLAEFKIEDPEGAFSADGTGLTATNASGATFSVTPNRQWNNVRIYFKRQPGGGSLLCYTHDGGTMTRINTAGTAIQLDSVDLKYEGSASGEGLRCFDINGKVTVFGGLFSRSDRGVLFIHMARPGRTLALVAAQDSSFRRQWFAAFQPKWFVLNGGMNDRGVATPDQHEANLKLVVNDAKAGSPSTKIAIVQSAEPGDDKRSFYNAYVPRQKSAADATGALYIDLRTQFGTYEQASARGLMGDLIHPSSEGYRLTAEYIGKQTGLYTDKIDPGFSR
jgi:lysophospholipase L1-like esterase